MFTVGHAGGWASNNTCISSIVVIVYQKFLFMIICRTISDFLFNKNCLFLLFKYRVLPLNTNYVFFILPYKKQLVLVLTKLCRNLVCFHLISKYISKVLFHLSIFCCHADVVSALYAVCVACCDSCPVYLCHQSCIFSSRVGMRSQSYSFNCLHLRSVWFFLIMRALCRIVIG